jgi:hypothetical protein
VEQHTIARLSSDSAQTSTDLGRSLWDGIPIEPKYARRRARCNRCGGVRVYRSPWWVSGKHHTTRALSVTVAGLDAGAASGCTRVAVSPQSGARAPTRWETSISGFVQRGLRAVAPSESTRSHERRVSFRTATEGYRSAVTLRT